MVRIGLLSIYMVALHMVFQEIELSSTTKNLVHIFMMCQLQSKLLFICLVLIMILMHMESMEIMLLDKLMAKVFCIME